MDDEITRWADIGAASRAHLVAHYLGGWAQSACGKWFPEKDVYPMQPENPKCKNCIRSEPQISS